MSKIVPQSAPRTNNPYSSILEVKYSKLAVICGQVSENSAEQLLGSTIEEQAEQTLKNCAAQLAHASCTLDDVFKVTVFIANMSDWGRFNIIYRGFFKEPLPVRTVVQAGLPDGYLIEIEMWAAIK